MPEFSPVSRAVVTGASGFLGRHVCRELAGRGCEVSVIRRPDAGPCSEDVHPIACDPADVEALTAVIGCARPDVIFHLAGRSRGSGAELEEANVGYARRLLRAARTMAVPPTFVAIGSAAEYGRPIRPDGVVNEDDECRPVSAYGVSKLEQTRIVLGAADAGLRVVVARLFNPIGRGSPAWSAFGRFAREVAAMPATGGTLTTGPVGAVRDFTDAAATARALVRLGELPAPGGLLVNVCSGQGTRVGHAVERLIALAPVVVRHRVDVGLGGTSDLDVVIGDPSRLAGLGIRLPPLDLDAALAGMLDEHREIAR